MFHNIIHKDILNNLPLLVVNNQIKNIINLATLYSQEYYHHNTFQIAFILPLEAGDNISVLKILIRTFIMHCQSKFEFGAATSG